tara:strand:- start:7605 stop:8378 length:774 start_codon:yes stop_codon:yes gene_type:complete
MRAAPLILFFFGTVFSQMTGREIMEKMDAQPEPETVISTSRMSLVKIRKGKERKRIREVKRHQKYYEEGEFDTKSMIRFLKPADVKGTGFLMWEYRDPEKEDNQWLYLPALKKVKQIAGNQKTESFMGSDFTYEDMEGRSIDEDTFTLLGEEVIFGESCYKVESVPIGEDESYTKRIVWISKENWTLRKVEYYDKRRNLFKVLTVPEHHQDGDYWNVDKMIMENVQKSHKTVLELSDVEYDREIKDSFFTERFLKRE